MEKDLRFCYDEKELKSFHDLTQRFKADRVYQLLKDKVEIREGSVGGQKFILTNSKDITNYFMLVPHDLNLISLGVMSTENPIFLNSFEDSGNQYLNIFNSVWNNSKKDLKETVLKNISKAVQHFGSHKSHNSTNITQIDISIEAPWS
ncbi:MAG: hypothetical protein EOO85_27175 [Pedobacter sp.]|nr:MAG: hypothetical protein EOO85_27175 [Pedobacter sp.]